MSDPDRPHRAGFGTRPRDVAAEAATSERRVWLWLSAVVLCVSMLFHGGDIGWSDGMSMYQVARSIVEDGDVAIELGVVWEGADGRYYSPFGLGLSLVALPVYSVVRLVRVAFPVPEPFAQGLVSFLSPFILALMAVAVHRLARRLGAGVGASAGVALGAALGTFVMIYGKAFWSEPLAALLVTVAIERTLARAPLGAGVAAAAAALTRPQLFLFAPIVVWGLWRQGGSRQAVRALAPLAIAALVQVGYNVVRWGDPLNVGYVGTEVPQGFTTPILDGLRGLLLDPEKSVLLFAPIVLLIPLGLAELWRRAARVAFWMILSNLAIAFVLSATWWDWGGGFTWGPRLLIPGIVPALSAIAPWADRVGRRSRRLVVVAVLFGLGALVSAPSLVIGGGAQLADDPPPSEGPRIIRQAQLVPETVAYTLDHPFEDTDARDPSRTLDLWQFALAWQLGPPGLLASAVVSCVLVGGVVFGLRRLRREVAFSTGMPDVARTRDRPVAQPPTETSFSGPSTKDR